LGSSQSVSCCSQSTESPLEPEQKRRRTDKTLSTPEARFSKPDESELWTEKYQFKSESDIVTNNSQLERLKEWLTNWKRLLAKPETAVVGRKVGKKGKKYADSESEYYDSDFSNSESSYGSTRKFYANGLLLSGPHGCGKTSSVYAIAKLLGFKVFEVNASSARNKNAIIAELEGAINSHHVNGTTARPETGGGDVPVINRFFNKAVVDGGEENRLPQVTSAVTKNKSKKRKNSLRRETIHNLTNKINFNFANKSKVVSDGEDEDGGVAGSDDSDLDADEEFFKRNKNHKVTVCGRKSGGKLAERGHGGGGDAGCGSLNIQRESLILFDEIDVIFKEDYGFWSAILHFIKRSRKPIVLTTTDEFLQVGICEIN
jgi:hypothetical protein